MADYDARTVLIDLGFIQGYCLDGNSLPNNWGMFEALLDALDRISEYAIKGSLEDLPKNRENYAKFLLDIGCVRGLLWAHPISGAVSEALKRLIAFATDNSDFPYTLLDGGDTTSESIGQMLSDDQREVAVEAALSGEDTLTEAFAKEIDAPLAGITRYWRSLGAIDSEEEGDILAGAGTMRENAASIAEPSPDKNIVNIALNDAEQGETFAAGSSDNERSPDSQTIVGTPAPLSASEPAAPFNLSGKRGTREWTPEQRAAQAERAKGRKKPPFDDDLDTVKADFDAGMSPLDISRKWGCSDSHIRNFLTKHGVDPRRQKIELPAYEATPRPEYEWNDESRAQLFAMRDEGKTWKEIGDVLGRTPSACSSMFTMLVKAGKAPPKHSTPAPMPALSSEDIPEVQEMLDKDYSYETIGEWFGCDAEAVRQFCQDHKLIPAHKMAEVRKGYEARQAAITDQATICGDVAEDQTTNRPEAIIAEDEQPTVSDFSAEEPCDTRPAPEPSPPAPADRRAPGYAGKREDGQLRDDDWPDIKARIARGDSRRSIASDYEADLEDLEFFIASCERLEAKQPPGEARAPL